MEEYSVSRRVTCPHCQVKVLLEPPSNLQTGNYWMRSQSQEYYSNITLAQCPDCLRHLITLSEAKIDKSTGDPGDANKILLWPQTTSRPPVPSEVPIHIAEDFNEAAAVLQLSAKASAALSRRCLQAVLREAGKTRAKNLNDQIDEVLPNLPSNIASNLDAIRVVGNFAAHPIKSQHTGAIIEVEIGEADWNLDVLDALFDFYYVRPELERKKREELNKKLQEAGKPPLKQ
jgi:hypothetical protein